MFDTPQAKIDEMHRREIAVYGDKSLKHYPDPFAQLILTVLSQRTTWADEKAAFDAMWAHYGSWPAIAEADTAELTQLIARTRYPEVKAPYIKAIVRHILDEHGEATLDFIHGMTTEDALRTLTDLPGVGAKTATLVLLFCFHRPVMPVDTHVHRVTTRVGVLPPKMSAEKAHTYLLTLLPPDAQVLYTFHRNNFTHGQQVCQFKRPICSKCPLTDLCDYFQREVAPKAR